MAIPRNKNDWIHLLSIHQWHTNHLYSLITWSQLLYTNLGLLSSSFSTHRYHFIKSRGWNIGIEYVWSEPKSNQFWFHSVAWSRSSSPMLLILPSATIAYHQRRKGKRAIREQLTISNVEIIYIGCVIRRFDHQNQSFWSNWDFSQCCTFKQITRPRSWKFNIISFLNRNDSYGRIL